MPHSSETKSSQADIKIQ